MNKIRLADIANIEMGQSPEGEFCSNEKIGIPLLNGPAEFTDRYPIPVQFTNDPKKFAKEGDILFCVRGSTTGRMNMADRAYAIGRGLAAIRHKEGREYQAYLRYLIEFYLNSILKLTSGSTFPNLTADLLSGFELFVPSLPIQKKISKVLSALDAKIELNQRINAELEAMAKMLYDYWFVQFDFPYDFDKGMPDKKGKPYKSSGGKMVWREELKREVPEGWEVKCLGEEIEIQRGISYTSKEINGIGIPMINLNSFNLDGTYKSDGIKKYSGKFAEKNIVKVGDLLIAATDVTRNAEIIGRAILVPDYYDENLVFSMDIAKIISKTIPYSFLMMLFNSNHYHNYIKYYATGTLVLHLNLDGINRYKTELPPLEILKKFDELYLPIANRIYLTAKENQKLTELRDWLLPMLMNGQVRVKGAGVYEIREEELRMVAEE